MYIKQFILASITVLLYGCIGEDPDKKDTAETTAATSAPATTSSGSKTTPGTPGVESAIYQVRTTPNSILQTYFQQYTKLNATLDQRDAHATTHNIDTTILQKLEKWSDSKTKWTDQHKTKTDVPPEGANVRILYDQGGSVLAADGAHVVQNLQLDQQTGLYLPADTSVLATQVEMGQKSWIDIRGRMGAAEFDMDPGSIVDLTRGYGLLLDSEIADLEYDKAVAETGVLDIKEHGKMRIDEGALLLHKAAIAGNLWVLNATFNFQTRLDSKTENIGFFHTQGKIHNLDKDQFPDIMMTVNGPFQLKTGAEIEVFLTTDKASKIILKYPFSHTKGSDEPVIQGKFRFIPKVDTLQNGEFVVIESDIGFPADVDLSQLVAGNVILGKQLSLVKKAISGDASYSDKQGIYVKVENSTAKLNASLPIQHAIETFRQGEIKAELWQGSYPFLKLGNIIKTRLIINNTQHIADNNSVMAQTIGLNHTLDFEFGNLTISQLFNQVQVHNSSYRFISHARDPFWMMQHSIKFQKPLDFNGYTLTPSIGLCHIAIPTTIFQDSAHTFHPEIGITNGFFYNAESDQLSFNLLATGLYTPDWGQLEDQLWSFDVGWNASLRTPYFTFSSGLLNPLGTSPEFYFKFFYEF